MGSESRPREVRYDCDGRSCDDGSWNGTIWGEPKLALRGGFPAASVAAPDTEGWVPSSRALNDSTSPVFLIR
jgi:hypothetical protein